MRRTLTDEQIRIFRHSEIHAVLRARQLREDDEEYEARMGKSLTDDENQDEEGGEEPTKSSHQEAIDGDTQLKSVHEEKKSKKKKKKKKSTTKNSSETAPVSESLDYGEDNVGHDTPQTERPVSNAPYSGRRIVSYDD